MVGDPVDSPLQGCSPHLSVLCAFTMHTLAHSRFSEAGPNWKFRLHYLFSVPPWVQKTQCVSFFMAKTKTSESFELSGSILKFYSRRRVNSTELLEMQAS